MPPRVLATSHEVSFGLFFYHEIARRTLGNFSNLLRIPAELICLRQIRCPHEDSNPDYFDRNEAFYPLNYRS